MAKISNDYCQYLFNVTAFDPGFKPKILHDERCSNAIDQNYPMFDCRGDSGGPAFVTIEGSFSLHSVVSSGIGVCGELPFSNGTGSFYPPTIKQAIFPHAEWINEIIKNNTDIDIEWKFKEYW